MAVDLMVNPAIIRALSLVTASAMMAAMVPIMACATMEPTVLIVGFARRCLAVAMLRTAQISTPCHLRHLRVLILTMMFLVSARLITDEETMDSLRVATLDSTPVNAALLMPSTA